MTTIYENQVQELYIAYFGRAADPGGLAFYAGSLSIGETTIEAIASSFANSSEAQDIIALSTTDFLTKMYQQAFSRVYDTQLDGTFWADAIESGATTKSLAMVQILQGAPAGSQDETAVVNKVTVATAFTTEVEEGEKKYAGSDVAALAKALLDGVTPDETTVTVALGQVPTIVNTMSDLNDVVPPAITSGDVATAIDENSGAAQVIYTVTSNEVNTTYGLSSQGGDDSGLFTIDVSTGEVTLTGDPDFETNADYTFTVVATDQAGNASEKPITLDINDLDEIAPVITSASSASTRDENTGAGQALYYVSSDDPNAIYSLKAIDDSTFFTIHENTGAVTLIANPDYETKPNYSFTVIATDASDNASEKAITLNINDVDENGPVISSSEIADAIDENSGATQVIYTVTSNDANAAYTLKPDEDSTLFTIEGSTGQVTLIADPDHETKDSYSFTVIATDTSDNASEKTVTLAINDIDELTKINAEDLTTYQGTDGIVDTFVYEIDSSNYIIESKETADIVIEGFNVNEDKLIFEDVSNGTTSTEFFIDDAIIDSSTNTQITFEVELINNDDIVIAEEGFSLTLIGITEFSAVDYSVT